MGKLTDKVFVFTGTMEHPRGELAALVVENGGTVKNSVTKSTTYLVLADHNRRHFGLIGNSSLTNGVYGLNNYWHNNQL